MIADNHPECTEVMVMFLIFRRSEWEALQSWHRACTGSTVEYLLHRLYVLTVPAGGVEKRDVAT